MKVMKLLATLFGRRARKAKASFRRWEGSRLVRYVPLLALLLAGVGGCDTYGARHVETITSPNGTVTVKETTINGGALILNRGIQRANVIGLGTVEGYNSSPSVEAMRALGQGMGEAVGVAVKAGVKP